MLLLPQNNPMNQQPPRMSFIGRLQLFIKGICGLLLLMVLAVFLALFLYFSLAVCWNGFEWINENLF